jgi:lysophospholipase L1-like esterase
MDPAAIQYVALGDSYTIGTSVEPDDRWPNQLVAALAEAPDRRGAVARNELELVANLAVNGFTARDVLLEQVPRLAAFEPGFVSVLVGVNDVVKGVPDDGYRGNVGMILEAAVRLVGAGRALFVTTPDYTVTPAGADYGDPEAVAAAIRRYNAIGDEVARAGGVAVVDIHDLSLRAGTDRTLVARDGLHPSGAQYSLWTHRIAPVVAALLARPDN